MRKLGTWGWWCGKFLPRCQSVQGELLGSRHPSLRAPFAVSLSHTRSGYLPDLPATVTLHYLGA